MCFEIPTDPVLAQTVEALAGDRIKAFPPRKPPGAATWPIASIDVTFSGCRVPLWRLRPRLRNQLRGSGSRGPWSSRISPAGSGWRARRSSSADPWPLLAADVERANERVGTERRSSHERAHGPTGLLESARESSLLLRPKDRWGRRKEKRNGTPSLGGPAGRLRTGQTALGDRRMTWPKTPSAAAMRALSVTIVQGGRSNRNRQRHGKFTSVESRGGTLTHKL